MASRLFSWGLSTNRFIPYEEVGPPFSNPVSRDRFKVLWDGPLLTMEQYADAAIAIMRQDPFYLDTSNERPRRTAISQFSKAYQTLAQMWYGADYDYLSYNLSALFDSRLNAEEANIMGIQHQIEYRDAREDNALLPMQLVENTAHLIQYVGLAYIGAGVASGIAAGATTTAAASAGAATEAGSLAGSAGLLTGEAGTSLLTTQVIAQPTLGVATGAVGLAESGGVFAAITAGLGTAGEAALTTVATTAAAAAAKNLTSQPSGSAAELSPTGSVQTTQPISNNQKILIAAASVLSALFLF